MVKIKPYIKGDIKEIEEYLEKHAFDWNGNNLNNRHRFLILSLDLLTKEDYKVVETKHYFTEIAGNSLRYIYFILLLELN